LTRAQGKIEELKGLRPGRDHGGDDERSRLEPCARHRQAVSCFQSSRAALPDAADHGRRTFSPRSPAARADLGIGFDFTRGSHLKVLARAAGKLGAVMAPSHPLAKRNQIRLGDCVDYPLVIADGSTVIRPYLDSAFAKASLEPLPIIETNAIEIMRHAAILDNGITFLTPFDIEFERRVGRLGLCAGARVGARDADAHADRPRARDERDRQRARGDAEGDDA
jgi:hypothetical protein